MNRKLSFINLVLFITAIFLSSCTNNIHKQDADKSPMEVLKSGSLFWSKLGWGFDPPKLDSAGNQILFGNLGEWAQFHRDFAKAGIKLHTSIIPSGWVDVDTYDYRATDQVLDSLFKGNPDILYIPRIKLNVPINWGKKYPEELFVYYEGPRDVEGIRSLAGTLKQDILGYEDPRGYNHSGQQKDTRPNVGGLISNQSFASKQWLHDAGEALKRFIDHLEQSPYADKILGYHLAYGTMGETVLWGRISGRFGDYGIASRKAFFQWGIDKYKTLENLRKVWMQPNMTESTLEIPSPEMRENRHDSLRMLFRGNAEDQICIDYDYFMSEINADAIEYLGKIVKDETQGRALVGSFYGYILEVGRSAYTGHLAIDRLLDSPYLDFLAGPASYYRRNVGEPGGELAPVQSINLKKYYLSENDLGSYLISMRTHTHNFEESRTEFWREFAKNTAHGAQQWWMDLVGGTYDSPGLMHEIQTIEDTYHTLQKTKAKSISEILLVVDDQSFYHLSVNKQLHRLFMLEFVREATLCGAPVDIYRFSDLDDIDLSQYKLISFVNPFYIDPHQLELVKSQIPAGSTLLWFYTPGIVSPDFDIANVEKTTGFKIKEINKEERPEKVQLIPSNNGFLKNTAKMDYMFDKDGGFPLVQLEGKGDQTILAKYANGKIAGAMYQNSNGQTEMYFSLPLLRAEHFRVVAEKAGCRFYAPVECAVYGDNRFISLFPHQAIDYTLQFPQKANVTDIITGKKWEKVDSIPIQMDIKTVKFLIIE